MNTQTHEIMPRGEVIIYQTADGQTSIDVKMENETVWLTQAQMSMLFQKDQSVIARHIQNVFREGELDEMSNMQIVHNTLSKYKPTRLYNLDVIISVGYRVKSQRGTQFRIWANRVLKEYLVRGYAINNKLAAQKYEELSQLVQILGRTIQSQPELTNKESSDLVAIVTSYNYALDTLDNYDYERLTIQDTTPEERFHATYENAMAMILRRKQAHRRHALPLVHAAQRPPVPPRRHKAHSRRHPRSPHPDDSREPHGGEGRDGEGCGQPH